MISHQILYVFLFFLIKISYLFIYLFLLMIYALCKSQNRRALRLEDRNICPELLNVCLLRCVGRKSKYGGARCSSVVRAFAHGVMGHRIDPS